MRKERKKEERGSEEEKKEKTCVVSDLGPKCSAVTVTLINFVKLEE